MLVISFLSDTYLNLKVEISIFDIIHLKLGRPIKNKFMKV